MKTLKSVKMVRKFFLRGYGFVFLFVDRMNLKFEFQRSRGDTCLNKDMHVVVKRDSKVLSFIYSLSCAPPTFSISSQKKFDNDMVNQRSMI